jgi:ABC-type multidrug transport system permease subunit
MEIRMVAETMDSPKQCSVYKLQPLQQFQQISFFTQTCVLTARFFTNWYRDNANLFGAFTQALLMGLALMGIFWNISDDDVGIRTRYGVMGIAQSSEPYAVLVIQTQRLCSEMPVFDREIQDGMYAPGAYFAAHFIASLPQFLIQPLLFGVPLYFGAGLREGARHVVVFLCIMAINGLVCNGLAWASVSLNRAFQVASLIGNSCYTFIGLTTGFIINFSSLPVYVEWVRYISFASYGFELLMLNEFRDRVFPKATQSGDDVLDSLHISRDEPVLWTGILIIGAMYYVVAVICLYILKFPPSGTVGSGGADSIDESGSIVRIAETDDETAEVLSEPFEIVNVSVHGVSLIMKLPPQRNFRRSTKRTDTAEGQAEETHVRQSERKVLLSSINAVCKSGRVSALMGGSGKPVKKYHTRC